MNTHLLRKSRGCLIAYSDVVYCFSLSDQVDTACNSQLICFLLLGRVKWLGILLELSHVLR